MQIKYPTWKVRGSPTPNEKLMVCHQCGHAVWVPHSPLTNVVQCVCRRRMTEANKNEYEIGKGSIKCII